MPTTDVPKYNKAHLKKEKYTYQYCGHTVVSSIFHARKYDWCPKCMLRIKRERESLRKSLPFWIAPDEVKISHQKGRSHDGRNRIYASRRFRER